MTNFMIIGASRGLGAALAVGVPDDGDSAWLVSRTRPDSLEIQDGVEREWIKADLSDPASAQTIAQAVHGKTLDVVIYNAGVWERNAFQERYDFTQTPLDEMAHILNVNLLSAITCMQALVPNLRQSHNPKALLIGSISGLENNGGREVTYDASKFGLRGVAHALRETWRKDRIAVTILNPGSIDTSRPYTVVADDPASDGIPLRDLVNLTRCVVSLSRHTCIKEVDIPAMQDTEA